MQLSPGHRPSYLGRASVDSQMSHNQTQAIQQGSARIAHSSSPSQSSTSGSSLSEIDTGANINNSTAQQSSLIVATSGASSSRIVSPQSNAGSASALGTIPDPFISSF